MEGQLTGDGRYIEHNALSWDLPMPLRYVSSDVGEHGGAQVAGRILIAERRPGGVIWAAGDYDMASPIGQEAERQVREGFTTGVSMDLDNVGFEVRVAADLVTADPQLALDAPEVNEDGTVTLVKISPSDEVRSTLSARVRAATIVAIPAFAEARLSSATEDVLAMVSPPSSPGAGAGPVNPADCDGLLPDGTTPCSTDPNSPDYDPDCVASTPAQSVNSSTSTSYDDLPSPPRELLAALADKVGNHVDSERHLIKWFEHGEGAAFIGYGTDGQFERCLKLAEKHMPPEESKGFCANRIHSVTGEWPGKNAHKKHSASTTDLDGLAAGATATLLAPVWPPVAWFQNPSFKLASPLTVTDQGRVLGHLAAWNTCHIGMMHKGCVTAPHSRAGYAYFHTGSLVTEEGAEIAVGHITIGTRHASTTDPALTAASAQAHYDNTGTTVADVVAGEDAFGIWISGAVRPSATAQQLRELRAAPLSGDWRRVAGNLELVAALGVNVPGFPIPRPNGMVAGGVVQSLVASGMVPPRQVLPPGAEGALSLDDLRYLKRLADRERREEQALQASGSLPSATDLARRVRASTLAMRAHASIKSSTN